MVPFFFPLFPRILQARSFSFIKKKKKLKSNINSVRGLMLLLMLMQFPMAYLPALYAG